MKYVDIYLVLLFFAFTDGSYDDSFEILLNHARRQSKSKITTKRLTNSLNQTYFLSLENYQVNARRVSEEAYPWIARVVHSRSAMFPHMCTAVCVDEGIFITAARCIYSLIVSYTTVIYQQSRLPAVAFVLPSKTTKQLHDDIGFIVVDQSQFRGIWTVIEIFGLANRTDDMFKWFSRLESTFTNVMVLGYATKKGLHRIKSPDRQYNLTELNVVVGMDICFEILTPHGKIEGFLVPCYHSCNLKEFNKKNVSKCRNYHGVEGGAVFDKKLNKLLGVATWGAYFHEYELPVGFSVANSINFFNDYSCAKRIRDEDHGRVRSGSYQNLC